MARGIQLKDVASAAGWSLSWAAGVGLGVVAGAFLTVTSGEAAPGAASLGGLGLLKLPLAAAAAAFAVLFVAKLVVSVFRRKE
ncbi:MAG: hypothetical protein FWE94_02465 [Coriobacteriia bacterium]|nr:hypothetical protein [Coriobacteriia bacterium]